jgi:hypothetical protein
VKLDWMGLANYAEDQGGLLYIMGGGWDTMTVHAPVEGAPEGVFAPMRGTLVIRLLFHQSETDHEHRFRVAIADEDGAEVGSVEGNLRVDRVRGLPVGWDQNVHIAIPLLGLGLPRPGNYVITLLVNDQFVGDRPFRVLKGY